MEAGAGGALTVSCAYGFGEYRVGDVFFVRLKEPDRRWWPRLKAWVLRRPPPVRDSLQRFKVTKVMGSTMQVKP